MKSYFVKRDPTGKIIQKIMYSGQGSGPAGCESVTQQEHDAITFDPVLGYADYRRREYPSVGDQLDALWKGEKDADEMKQRILKVKERYPKS